MADSFGCEFCLIPFLGRGCDGSPTGRSGVLTVGSPKLGSRALIVVIHHSVAPGSRLSRAKGRRTLARGVGRQAARGFRSPARHQIPVKYLADPLSS
jgi:hypothetical protein